MAEIKNQTKFREHCMNLYGILSDESVNGIFEGKLRDVCDQVKIPDYYRSQVLKRLYDLNALKLLRRGTGNILTQIEIGPPPPEGAWPKARPSDALTRHSDFARLESEVREIQNRLGSINVVQALYEIEQRLGRLERTNNATQTHSNTNT